MIDKQAGKAPLAKIAQPGSLPAATLQMMNLRCFTKIHTGHGYAQDRNGHEKGSIVGPLEGGNARQVTALSMMPWPGRQEGAGSAPVQMGRFTLLPMCRKRRFRRTSILTVAACRPS